VTDAQLIESAAAGDEGSFAELMEPHRRGLTAHCYRMLGSVQDAEDAVQDTLLRAWRGLAAFRGQSTLRGWLYEIATNVCLRAIERRPSRRLPVGDGEPGDPREPLGAPLVDSVWIEPYPDERFGLEEAAAGPAARYEQRESIELGFIAALQLLPPRQRAVLILRDVLGFSGAEVADALDTTPGSVYSALQRAHATLDERRPDPTQQATLRTLGDEQLNGIVQRFVQAWARSDVDAIVGMLTGAATLAMPPVPSWYRGRDAVERVLRGTVLDGVRSWRMLPTSANGQPALAAYELGSSGRYAAHGVTVLTLEGPLIAGITHFRAAPMIERFGLPRDV
jgi:RNA polymerase sigma-70 factor (ECF subfamily)